jgi:glycosyltransferase involved in cell wall biosynthesis
MRRKFPDFCVTETTPPSRRICLTPTRNESWIIKPFLSAAKLWSDDIIVVDQNSTDGTLEELQKTSRVHVITNPCADYNEVYRQRILIEAARRLSGKRILIALDADEALSANSISSADWKKISEAAPGTVLRFKWVNLLPGFRRAWIPPQRIACGFVDDGSEHSGTQIHNQRVPRPAQAPVIDLDDIVVLHFQYVVWERMLSKHRWYQAWEHINNPDKKPLEIFRKYHHMHGSWDDTEITDVRTEWLEAYGHAGIDFTTLRCEEITWWDQEIVAMLLKHTPTHFSRIALWDKNWNSIAAKLKIDGAGITDPRGFADRAIHRLLAATQRRRTNVGVRLFERFLRSIGW